MTTISPTHTCFDDALDLLEAWVKENHRLAHATDIHLVHGICLNPMTGEPFSHAWVERDGCVWQDGYLPTGHRITYAVKADEFALELRPQDVTRYTIREAWLENERTGHYGPWVERYQVLCRKKGTGT